MSTATPPYKILRVYLKGASVEVPHMADLPSKAISPDVGVDMQTEASPAWPGALECVLRISMHARQNQQNIFMLEVSVAGVFEMDISDMEEAHRFVRKVAPTVLFPFARKDLAGLAVAAGFQPVLLDHVDFDAMLTQVMQSQKQARASSPMRVDVIAAKPRPAEAPAAPAMSPVAMQAPEPVAALAAIAAPIAVVADTPAPVSEWPDTAPETIGEAATHLPQKDSADDAGASLAARGLGPRATAPRHRALGTSAAVVVVVGLIGLTAAIGWHYRQNADEKIASVVPKVPAVAPAAPLVALPASAASAIVTPPVPVYSAETSAAIASSQARLAEQPAQWFTLDLGTTPASRATADLGMAAQDRPLFVLPAKGRADQLRRLYGVYPSQAAAEQALTELRSSPQNAQQAATVVTIGGL